jgi:secernin
MLFAKSSDRPIDEPQVLEVLDRRPVGTDPLRATYVSVPDAGSALVLGSRPTWMWGCEHGLNEHRLAVGNEKVWTIDDPRGRPDALLGMDLVRLVLERAHTADEGLDVLADLLAEHGQGGSGEEHGDEPYWSSFLLVDPTGGWVVETSDRSWVAQPVGDGTAISNRLTLRTTWTRASADVAPGDDWDRWRDPAAPTGIADHRLAATSACVARGSVVTPADAIAVLRDHGTGPWGAPDGTGDPGPEPVPTTIDTEWHGVTVCMHVRGYQCTTASMVADLPEDPDAPVRAWVSLGTPCTGAFVPVALLGPPGDARAVVTSALSDSRVWEDASRLSRAVEALGPDGSGGPGADALREVRAAFGRFEAQAWAEADDLWSSGSDVHRWRAAAGRWDGELRDVLPALVRLVEA